MVLNNKDEANRWLRDNLGGTYYIQGLAVLERTPAGPRTVLNITDPDGKPWHSFNDYHKQKVWDQESLRRKSKFGKDSYDNYQMNEKWHKDIKSRKAVQKKKIVEGDRVVEAGFSSSTGERVS